MKKWHLRFHLAVTLLVCASGFAQKLDVFSVREDLAVPPAVTNGAPGAGRFVREFLPEYKGTEIYHALYLPTDWVKGKTYPVIFEYAGNTIELSPDPNNGRVEGCRLGYGITKGSGCIWVCLPYVEPDHKTYARRWWGDREATVNYCKTVVQKICRDYGGDTNALFLAGFSRGAIACNFIGLHDDEIAAWWTGFICHSHYDGADEKWPYAGSDRASATKRLSRLGDRPQFISHELSGKLSLDQTKDFLTNAFPEGNFTFVQIPYTNHTDRWIDRDIPERNVLRTWFQKAAKTSSAAAAP